MQKVLIMIKLIYWYWKTNFSSN